MKLNLSLYYFFFFASVAIYVIFLPQHLKMSGYTPQQIGIIFASLPISRFITPLFFAKKPITTEIFKLSIFVSAVIPLPLFIDNFYIYLAVFIILGVLYSINFPYIEAIAINRLKHHYGKTRLWGSIGFLVVALSFSYIKVDMVTSYFLLNLITAYYGYKFINPKLPLF